MQYKSGETWVFYQDKDYTKTKTYVFPDSLSDERTHIQTYWTESGRKFIHNLMQQGGTL